MEPTPAEINLWRIRQPYDAFLQNRLTTISHLFGADAFSIDAIILSGTVLTALANRRYGRRNADQENFEQLLIEYWPGYVDRILVPRLLDDLRSEVPLRASLIGRIERDFLIHTVYSQIRQVTEDPTRAQWQSWCVDHEVAANERLITAYSYGRILFRDFRNSVQHRLEIADGWEARPLGFDRPFFYTNHSHRMLFGFNHPDLEGIVRDVIGGLRTWALATGTDMFETTSH